MNPYQNPSVQRITNNPYVTAPFPQQTKFVPSFQPQINDYQNPNNFSSPFGITPQSYNKNESISPPSYPKETRYPSVENFQYNRREPEPIPNYPYARQPTNYPPNFKPAPLSRSMISKTRQFEEEFASGAPSPQMFSPNNRNIRPNLPPPPQYRNPPRSLEENSFRPPPQYSPENFELSNRRQFEIPAFERNPYEGYERPILREKPFLNNERAQPVFANERAPFHFVGERGPSSYINEKGHPSPFNNERGFVDDRMPTRFLNERGPPPPPSYLYDRPAAFEGISNEFNPRRSYDILPPPPEFNPRRSFEMLPPPTAHQHRPLPPPEFPSKIPYHMNERPLFDKPFLNFDRPLSSSFIPSLFNRPNFDSNSIPRSNYDISTSLINRTNFDNLSNNSIKPTHLKKEYDDLAEILKECIYFDRSVEKCKEELARRPEFKLVDLMRFLDDNHTGAVTPTELKEGLKKLGLNPDENDLALVINRYSRDGNNRIEGGELSQMILPISGLNKTSILSREGTGKLSKETAASIVKLFKMLLNTNFSCEELRKDFAKKNYNLLEIFKFIGGQNGENMIQRNELKAFLEKFFFYPTKEDLDNLCHRFDRNNTGSINFKEFEYELMPKQRR